METRRGCGPALRAIRSVATDGDGVSMNFKSLSDMALC